ncbi:hypothetical protein Tco_0648087 [Tanacetum coccineum]
MFDDIYVAEKNGAYLAHERFAHNEAEKKAYAIKLLRAEHQTIGLSAVISGEPPLILSSSVHYATRATIKEARKQLCFLKGVDSDAYDSTFKLNVPVTMALDVFLHKCRKVGAVILNVNFRIILNYDPKTRSMCEDPLLDMDLNMLEIIKIELVVKL